MEVIARQVIVSAVLPAVVYVAVGLGLRVVLSARARDGAQAVIFATCFAWGQVRNVGEVPWPPLETAHGFVYLVFAAVAGRTQRSTRIAVTFFILNVGSYLALYPLVESAPRTVILQWLGAQVTLGVAMALGARMLPMVYSVGTILVTAVLGAVMLDSGSTSLAMTSWLLGGMTAADVVVSRFRQTSTNDRVVQPVFIILLVMELINYVR